MEKDLNNLVKDLRSCAESIWKITCHQCGNDNEEECRIFDRHLLVDAAAAIEALQVEVQFYNALAEEWKSAAENKERLLGLYRAGQSKHFYSAMDDNGRIIANPCACMNISVFPDCSENPNS